MIRRISVTVSTLLITLLVLSFSSCTKKNMHLANRAVITSDTTKSVNIPESNISESNSDLFNVDYKQFYDELSGHGKWIEINANELGLSKYFTSKGIASGEIVDKDEFLSHVFGIKDAYADTKVNVDVDWGVFFVWSPDPGLAVAVSAGEPDYYVPYENGEWFYTDHGWYFQAATPYEDITCHYGRWVLVPDAGWIWVPGRVWAPAWVEWRDDDDYIAWAPIPPTCYFVDNVITYPWFDDEDRYICVRKEHFLDPDVYRYRYFYNERPNGIRVNKLREVNGLYVKGDNIMDRGPKYSDIQRHWGRTIDQMQIQRVHDMSRVSIAGNQMKVYSPQFSRINHTSMLKDPQQYRPKSYMGHDDAMSVYKTNLRAGFNNKNAAGNNNVKAKDKNSWNIAGNRMQNSNNKNNHVWNRNSSNYSLNKSRIRNNGKYNRMNNYAGANKQNNHVKQSYRSNGRNHNQSRGYSNNRRGSYKQSNGYKSRGSNHFSPSNNHGSWPRGSHNGNSHGNNSGNGRNRRK